MLSRPAGCQRLAASCCARSWSSCWSRASTSARDAGEGWLTDDGLQVGLQVAIARCCRHRRTRFCFGGYGSVDALPIGEGREGGKERMGPPAFAPRPSYPWSPAPRSSPPRSSAAPSSASAATVHTRGSSIACGQCFCTACARALHMRRGCTVCARALCVMTVC